MVNISLLHTSVSIYAYWVPSLASLLELLDNNYCKPLDVLIGLFSIWVNWKALRTNKEKWNRQLKLMNVLRLECFRVNNLHSLKAFTERKYTGKWFPFDICILMFSIV